MSAWASLTPSYESFKTLPTANFGGIQYPNTAVAIDTFTGKNFLGQSTGVITLGLTALPIGAAVLNDGAGRFQAVTGINQATSTTIAEQHANWAIGYYIAGATSASSYRLLLDIDPSTSENFKTLTLNQNTDGAFNLGSSTLELLGGYIFDPTQNGEYSVILNAIAQDGSTIVGQASIVVQVGSAAAPALSLSAPPTLPGAQLSEAYSLQLIAGGGSASGYRYALAPASAALPVGLSLNPTTGLISGTPTGTAGSYPVTVVVTDSGGNSTSLNLTLAVAWADVTVPVGQQVLPNAVLGRPYRAAIPATGGAGSYQFAVSSGQLPAGLQLDGATGVISGTPSQAQTQHFDITITGSNTVLSGLTTRAGGVAVLSATVSMALVVAAAAAPTDALSVPLLSPWALALLSGMSAAWGGLALHRQRRHAMGDRTHSSVDCTARRRGIF